jgi:hypothetical protein
MCFAPTGLIETNGPEPRALPWADECEPFRLSRRTKRFGLWKRRRRRALARHNGQARRSAQRAGIRQPRAERSAALGKCVDVVKP